MCRICRRTYNNEYGKNHRDKKSANNKKYYTTNSNKISTKRKEYRKTNPERIKEIEKKTVQNNWGKILKRIIEKRKTDPKYKIMNRMRSGFKGWLDGKQKTCSVIDLICLSKEEFIKYIESHFSNEMTWQNIHIDHYVPLSFFNPGNEQDMKIAWNYLNLRPLLGKDNISKSNTLPTDYLEHIELIKKSIDL